MREKNKKMIEKRCSKCGKVKPIKRFSKRYDRKCGYHAQCKDCSNKRIKQYMKEYRQRPYVKAKRKKTRQAYDYKYKKSARGKVSNKKYEKKKTENLHDHYIKHLLIQNTTLSYSDIPQGLLEIKRLQIQLIRKIKKYDETKCSKQ